MLQKLVKKKLGELSRHLCESPSEVGSDLGAFLVPSPEGDNVSHSVRLHINFKLPFALKPVSFINKSNYVTFTVKCRVFAAALMPALLYGCESWIGVDLKPVTGLKNWCLKQLLGGGGEEAFHVRNVPVRAVRYTLCNRQIYFLVIVVI